MPRRGTPGGFPYGNANKATAKEYINTVKRRLGEMEASKWCTQTINKVADHLKEYKINKIRCLAIGSPSETQNAQFQLAFLILLATKLDITTVTVWDPLFERFDHQVFENWGFTVTQDCEHDTETLHYVPHGPRSLNVSLASLEPLYYLGNDFKNFIPHSEIDIKDEQALMHLAKHHVQSFPISRHERCFMSMDHLALHIVNSPTKGIEFCSND